MINTNENKSIYELYEYELGLSMEDVPKSHFMGYVDGNYVAVENVDYFAPKAVTAKGDTEFFVYAIESYLEIMSKREFERFRSAYKNMKASKLYYQTF